MMVKAFILISVQAILHKAVAAQCIGQEVISNVPFVEGCCQSDPAVNRIVGANLLIDTSTPHEISGVSIYSDDLLIEGSVYVEGNLPFTGTVALEGILPATGTSLVSYECGNGDIGMAESIPRAGLAVLPPGGKGWVGLGSLPSTRGI